MVMFFLFGLVVFANDFNLQASVENDKVTLTWNNVFHEEPQVKEPESGLECKTDGDCSDGEMCSATNECIFKDDSNGNVDEKKEEENNDVEDPLEKEKQDEEIINCDVDNICPVGYICNEKEELCELDTLSGGGTGGAVVKIQGGFFSKVLANVLNFFKGLFGGEPVGISVSDVEGYIIYKHEQTGTSEEVIHDGSLSDFNCDKTCSYSYTEEVKGFYSYSVSSTLNNQVKEESGKTNPIEVIIESEGEILNNEEECVTNEECSEGYNCVENECVLIELEIECDENKPCLDVNKECKENICVDKSIPELECDENNPCEEEFECVDNVCNLIESETECNTDNDCDTGFVCNLENNICVVLNEEPECNIDEECIIYGDNFFCNENKICVALDIEELSEIECNTENIGKEEFQECDFDVGICQKAGLKVRTCIQEENEISWTDFSECDISEEEKCTSGDDCDSGMCDLNINSCLPFEFEDFETECSDSLDNDCDRLSDEEDDDCFVEENEDTVNNNSEGNLSEVLEQPSTRELSYGDENLVNRGLGGTFEDDVVGSQRLGGLKISLLTYIIISFVVLIVGSTAIYFYMFKFRKYKKSDIISWLEFSRNMLSKGSSIEDVKKKLNSYNLPEDFVKIVIEKLRRV